MNSSSSNQAMMGGKLNTGTDARGENIDPQRSPEKRGMIKRKFGRKSNITPSATADSARMMSDSLFAFDAGTSTSAGEGKETDKEGKGDPFELPDNPNDDLLITQRKRSKKDRVKASTSKTTAKSSSSKASKGASQSIATGVSKTRVTKSSTTRKKTQGTKVKTKRKSLVYHSSLDSESGDTEVSQSSVSTASDVPGAGFKVHHSTTTASSRSVPAHASTRTAGSRMRSIPVAVPSRVKSKAARQPLASISGDSTSDMDVVSSPSHPAAAPIPGWGHPGASRESDEGVSETESQRSEKAERVSILDVTSAAMEPVPEGEEDVSEEEEEASLKVLKSQTKAAKRPIFQRQTSRRPTPAGSLLASTAGRGKDTNITAVEGLLAFRTPTVGPREGAREEPRSAKVDTLGTTYSEGGDALSTAMVPPKRTNITTTSTTTAAARGGGGDGGKRGGSREKSGGTGGRRGHMSDDGGPASDEETDAALPPRVPHPTHTGSSKHMSTHKSAAPVAAARKRQKEYALSKRVREGSKKQVLRSDEMGSSSLYISSGNESDDEESDRSGSVSLPSGAQYGGNTGSGGGRLKFKPLKGKR